MAKLCFNRSGTTYSSLLAGSSSGLLVNTGGVTLGASATTGSVPVGGNYLQYSKGGSTYNVFLNNNYTTWTALGSAGIPGMYPTRYLHEIVYGNGIFVGMTNASELYSSTTGLSGSWTLRATMGSEFPTFLRFFGGRFHAKGNYYDPESSTSPTEIWTSVNGTAWTRLDSTQSESNFFLSYDGTTVLIGTQGTYVKKSTNNGSSWTGVNVPDVFGYTGFKFAGAYFYFGLGSAVCYKSTDLSSWTISSTAPIVPSVLHIHNHYYSNEKVLIWPGAGAPTVYYYSSDLVNWTTGTWPNSSVVRYFWCVNGLSYMSNGNSTTNCYVTVDGISWTLVSMTGGVTPSNSFPGYSASYQNLKSQYQEGIIGNFSGVNKLMLAKQNASTGANEFYVSDGI